MCLRSQWRRAERHTWIIFQYPPQFGDTLHLLVELFSHLVKYLSESFLGVFQSWIDDRLEQVRSTMKGCLRVSDAEEKRGDIPIGELQRTRYLVTGYPQHCRHRSRSP